MDPNPFWLSQIGFGIVAGALGFWAWHLWQTLNKERDQSLARQEAAEAREEARRKEYDAKLDLLFDRMFELADISRVAIVQNTTMMQEWKEGMRIYEKLRELEELQRNIHSAYVKREAK